MQRIIFVCLSLAIAGCGASSSESADLSRPKKDLSEVVTEEDLTTEEEDLATEEQDLAAPPDLAVAPDLTGVTLDLTPAPADLTGVTFDLFNADLVNPPDMTPVGKAPGSTCVADADCASKLCMPALPGGAKICVLSCKAQPECAAFVGSYCAPITVGGTDGMCVPVTTKSCAKCTVDTDCGVVNERCYQVAGKATGCAADCSIGGDAACPSGYACTSVSDGGKARRLCLPKAGECPMACTSAATCPGTATATSEPACVSSVCSFACKGENYDVDGDIANGCEVLDAVPPGHDKPTAKALADQNCKDGTRTTFTGKIVSDARVHQNPVVNGFSTASGSAPDYWKVKGLGSILCFNTYNATLTITDGTPGCGYKLTLQTDKNSAAATVSGSGTASLASPGKTDQWSNDSDILFIVEKVCSASTLPSKAAQYKVEFNL